MGRRTVAHLYDFSVATMYTAGLRLVWGFHSDDCGRPAACIAEAPLWLSGKACGGIVLKLVIGLLRLEVERGNTF